MSDKAERTIDWAFKGLVVGLLGICLTGGGYFASHMATTLETLEANFHDLDKRLVSREANAFTVQDGLALEKRVSAETMTNARKIGDVDAKTSKQYGEIMLILQRLEQRAEQRTKATQ